MAAAAVFGASPPLRNPFHKINSLLLLLALLLLALLLLLLHIVFSLVRTYYSCAPSPSYHSVEASL